MFRDASIHSFLQYNSYSVRIRSVHLMPEPDPDLPYVLSPLKNVATPILLYKFIYLKNGTLTN